MTPYANRSAVRHRLHVATNQYDFRVPREEMKGTVERNFEKRPNTKQDRYTKNIPKERLKKGSWPLSELFCDLTVDCCTTGT